MKKHLEDKLRMTLATQQAMNDNSNLWNSIPAMVTAMTALDTTIASIKGVRNVQEQDTSGVAMDKGSKKEDAIATGLTVIGGLKAFANASGNNTLLNKISYNRSEMEKARDTTLSEQLKIVRNEANNNIGSLGQYNISTAEVDALSAAIAVYELMIVKPRVALNVRKNATETLYLLLQEIDVSLNIMDGIMSTLEQTQPDFFQVYSNARIIVDSSSGGTGVNGTVSDKITGAPLGDVLVSINAPQHKTRANATSTTRSMSTFTNENGHYEMRRLAAGDYTITMEKEGYNKLVLRVTIKDKGIAEGDGEMERVPLPPPLSSREG